GAEYPADLVLVGAGVVARTELAAAAGLAVDDGIVVDEHLRTADPAIHAVGDCASHPNAHAGARVRLDSVQNATDQGRHVAAAAGLAVVDWIVVDEHLRTADPAIHAVGDCASHTNAHAGARVRLESVQNATDQGRHVAAALLGERRPYAGVPWFWSHQGELKL